MNNEQTKSNSKPVTVCIDEMASNNTIVPLKGENYATWKTQ